MIEAAENLNLIPHAFKRRECLAKDKISAGPRGPPCSGNRAIGEVNERGAERCAGGGRRHLSGRQLPGGGCTKLAAIRARAAPCRRRRREENYVVKNRVEYSCCSYYAPMLCISTAPGLHLADLHIVISASVTDDPLAGVGRAFAGTPANRSRPQQRGKMPLLGCRAWIRSGRSCRRPDIPYRGQGHKLTVSQLNTGKNPLFDRWRRGFSSSSWMVLNFSPVMRTPEVSMSWP